jgi:hypothetical protein
MVTAVAIPHALRCPRASLMPLSPHHFSMLLLDRAFLNTINTATVTKWFILGKPCLATCKAVAKN